MLLFISGSEIFVIVIVVYLFFGSKRMPTILRDIGKAINTLRNTSQQIKDEIIHESSAYQRPLEDEMEEVVSEMQRVSRVSKSSTQQQEDKKNIEKETTQINQQEKEEQTPQSKV